MSTRAMKRLQGNSRVVELPGNVDDELESLEIESVDVFVGAASSKQKKKSKAIRVKNDSGEQAIENPFELLNSKEDDEVEVEKEDQVAEDDQNTTQAETSQKKSKKKKKKNKIKQKEHENVHIQEEGLDEVEASVQEVNRILGNPGVASLQEVNNISFSASMKPLLHIDFRHLNPDAELKRLFGSEVIRGEQGSRNRRHRNRPLQRSSRLVQQRDTWHTTGGSGLSMKYLDQTHEFVFEHSLAYQKLQHKFADAVESGHPENIINILRENPYHIDSLIQLADIHRMNEDFQTGAESIEKALYGLECAFHPLFNLASGNCYLNYKRVENRALFLCLFKHILNLGRRGCNRTAFEFCKLLLSLDPETDPLNCLNMIDYYALRSEQFDHLVQLDQDVMGHDNVKHVPNFAMSVALAHFKIACRDGRETTTADEMLQDALISFPMLLMPLLDECSIQPDKRVSCHPFFSTVDLNDSTRELGRLVTLYVKRCFSCWKEPEVITWLQQNVMIVLDIADKGADPRLQSYPKLRQQGFRHPPLSLLRHYFLSEIPGIGLPRQYSSATVLNHDPFPPADSVVSYTRPVRPTVASQDSSGFLRSLLQSLRPSYNPYEPVGASQRRVYLDDDDDDRRAQGIPQQIHQSVNALMQAMRQLLTDPFAAAHTQAGDTNNHQNNEDDVREAEEEDDEDNDQG